MLANFIFIFACFSTAVWSLSSVPNEKFCVNCRHFIHPSNDLYAQTMATDIAFGKCKLFPKPEKFKQFLVSGIDDPIIERDFNFASTARAFKDMCGESGRKYERKKRAYNKKRDIEKN
jgi:hypothetical protein